MLIATDIQFSYRNTPVLKGVHFSAKAGQVTAIVGPNGSGKTTLLKVLTGEEQSFGNVSLNDVAVAPETARQLALYRGVLAQATQLAFPFKVLEVLRIGLLAGPYARNDAIMFQALEAVGLSGFSDRFYHELSGGEQQRTQLARVLCQIWQPKRDDAPCWLFLDEPVASLDIAHQVMIMDLARAYADDGGGVVTVMHDLNLTQRYADSFAVMKSGQILKQGTPEQVCSSALLSQAYDHPLQVVSIPGQRQSHIVSGHY